MRERHLRLAAVTVLTTGILAACGQGGTIDGAGGSAVPSTSSSVIPPPASATPDPSTSPSDGGRVRPGHALQITLVKSGGFAGVSEKVVIAEDGTWTFTDEERGTTESGALSAEQLSTLHGLAVSEELYAVPEETKSGPGTQCNDMFVYNLTVGDTVLHSDDCGQAPNDVFREITGLIAEATPI